MYCVFCGKYNPPEASFCFNCGKPMERKVPAQPLPATPAPVSLPIYAPPAAPPTYPYAPTPAAYPTNQPAAITYAPPVANPYAFNPYLAYNPVPFSFPPNIDASRLVRYHPLLQGVVGLPLEFYEYPQNFYSYVTPANRVAIVKRSNFSQRFGAFVLDSLILLIPNIILLTIAGSLSTSYRSGTYAGLPWWLYLTFYLLNFGYLWLDAVWGGSPGKKLAHIRIIRFDGNKPDWLTAFLRQFCGYLVSASPGLVMLIVISSFSLLSPVYRSGNSSVSSTAIYTGFIYLLLFPLLFAASILGFIWPIWDSKKQAWHDKLARTLVVENIVWVEGQNFGLPPKSS